MYKDEKRDVVKMDALSNSRGFGSDSDERDRSNASGFDDRNTSLNNTRQMSE